MDKVGQCLIILNYVMAVSNTSSDTHRYRSVRWNLTALVVDDVGRHWKCAVVHHGNDGHGHIRAHDICIRHAEEEHEGGDVPGAEAS